MAGDIKLPDIVAGVRVDTKGVDAGLNKVSSSARDAGKEFTGLQKSASNAVDGLTSKLTSGLGPASGQAKAALDGIGQSAISTGSLLTTAVAGGAAVAGAALVAFAVDGIGKFVDLASEVRNFGRATGLSAEDSSRMVAVLDDLGISSESGATAMFKLAKNTADGGEKLALYGVEVARAKDGTVNLLGTLGNVAEAYASTSDQGRRAELVMAAFGKAGQNLIPILEKGRAGLVGMLNAVKEGEVLSQKQIDDARRFELAIDDVQDSFRTLQIQAGQALLPYITSLADASTKTLDFLSDKGGVGGILGKFTEIVATGTPIGNLFMGLKSAFGGAGEEAKGAAAKFDLQVASLAELGVEVSDAELAQGELTEETKKAAAAAEKYKAMIEGLASSISTAYIAMGSSTYELTEQQRALAESFNEAKDTANQLKQGLDILVGVKIAATQAAINWEEKILSTSETLRENKATLDITTEAGRENTNAIFDMIKAGNSHVEAMQREGATSAEVSAAYSDHVAALRRVMVQAGYSEDQINALIAQYRLLAAQPDINKNINTYHNQYHTDYYNTVRSQDPWVGNMHTGGIVPGTGDVPMLLKGGEGVFTPDQMAVLGRALFAPAPMQQVASSQGTSVAPASAATAAPVVHTTIVVDRKVLAQATARGTYEARRR